MNVSLRDLDARKLHSAESAARALGVNGTIFRRYARTFVKSELEIRPGHHLYTPEQVRQVGEAIAKRVLVELGNEKRSATMKRVAAQRAHVRERKTSK